MTRRSTGPDRLTVEALYLRCEGLCEGCGLQLRGQRGEIGGHAAHHRRPRRMGGSLLPDTNSVGNLLMLNDDCHELAERNRTWAYSVGLLVRQDDAPAAVPLLLYAQRQVRGGPYRPRWVALTDDAGYRPVESVELPEEVG